MTVVRATESKSRVRILNQESWGSAPTCFRRYKLESGYWSHKTFYQSRSNHLVVNDTHRKNCFTQFIVEFTEIETWLFLTFFICLLNQLSSVDSIIKYELKSTDVWKMWFIN